MEELFATSRAGVVCQQRELAENKETTFMHKE